MRKFQAEITPGSMREFNRIHKVISLKTKPLLLNSLLQGHLELIESSIDSPAWTFYSFNLCLMLSCFTSKQARNVLVGPHEILTKNVTDITSKNSLRTVGNFL